ncbi:conserved uncharacterized protein [Stigmatella aurantiaca DW4/3-1]|uniref:Conserved uncharacterized protein n=1 Tax=Stigmatella aurantiaca (strain DW4/3-1) TaxID=378806 RepID=Q08V26_STIAD|nr:conserved uncharacterized protein [Stigmatella aurantiaca DW4/3-1]EAU64330.1 hypothetical protein STIAU_6530 [Stigmatella aurantiaca DW4/3-1]
MRLARLGPIVLCASLILTGCPDKQPTGPLDSGTVTDAVPDAGSGPVATSFTLRYQLGDAGLEPIAMTVDERPSIEPTSVLELRSSRPLRNYRIRLFDEADRAMISDDSVEESADGIVYRITLPNPLKTGHRYTLVADAQTGAAFTDSLGRELEDLRFEFQVAGEKEKPAPPPKKDPKKRR